MQVSAYTTNYTPHPPPPQFPIFGRAAGVCHQCRRSKARCDKFLPACTRCVSKRTRCVYGRQISANNSAGGVCTGDGEGVVPPTDLQTACIFEVSLDTCYKLVGMISVALLSDIDDAEQETSLLHMALKPTALTATSIVQTYKETVHSWFSVITDDQIDQFIESSVSGNIHGIDGMLLLSLALVSQPPCGHQGHNICSNLYKAVKQSFLLLQTASKPYIQILQIGLLLSLFEYGHGLEQESKLSVAASAAICRSHKSFFVARSEDDEELSIVATCRRAAVIMDCLVELPKLSTSRQSSAEDSSVSSTKSIWPYGKILKESRGSSSNFEMLFQVAGVVREAIQYIKDETTTMSPANSYTTIESRLRNVCYDLIRAAGPNSFMFCDSIALALSFLFELNVFHTINTQTPVSMADKLAIESSRRMAVDICKSMNEIVPKKGVNELSLIGLSTTCRAANLLAGIDVGLCEEGMFTPYDIKALHRAQHDFTQRWRVGATYGDFRV